MYIRKKKLGNLRNIVKGELKKGFQRFINYFEIFRLTTLLYSKNVPKAWRYDYYLNNNFVLSFY